jgi:hypothetical protein
MRLLLTMGAVALFCIASATRDILRKDYLWAGLAVACLLVIVLIPIPTHAEKVDLGRATGPNN